MKIGLLDHMGYGNLGDAATQEALIANIKRRVPDAAIIGFSLNPDDTRKRHKMLSYPITWSYSRVNNYANENSGKVRCHLKLILSKIPVLSWVAKRAWHLVQALAHLARSFTVLKSLDAVIIAGGGQLGELWHGPWSHPYNVLKFSILTKLANKKLLFLNVGAGPLDRALSKAFVKCSVWLADYVSFRDIESETLVRRLGVRRETHVFPDSVYALDISDYETSRGVSSSRFVVGLNPIGFCDPRIWPRKDPSVYSRYLDNLSTFALWLLTHNYGLRLFSSEASVDVYAMEDLKRRLRNSLSQAISNEMFRPPSESVKELLLEMSDFDCVVTSKFHGVVLSHLLGKPVIALSYHNKIDDLMRTVGHSRYCLNIERFDDKCLKKAFTSLIDNTQEIKSKFRQTVAYHRDALTAQFDQVFTREKLQPHSPVLGSTDVAPENWTA
jgi:polysaccharide pyruvyl transferase WcaK-like protein